MSENEQDGAGEALVEAVARAICDASQGQWRTNEGLTEQAIKILDNDALNNLWRYVARAAIAALQSRSAEPAGENPVAYLVQTDDERWLSWRDDDTPVADCDYKIVPLYARPAPTNPDRLVEAVRTTIARCEALEDEASNELVKADAEHAQGYWRGQKRTAKSIRRELHDLTRAALSAPALNGEKGE